MGKPNKGGLVKFSMKKFVIITACNYKYGDFLINHWLKSLLNNIDTKVVDIVVLDYGLSEEQRKNLLLKKVKTIECDLTGHIVNIRFSDMKNFLKKNKYEQIISSDGGDIIFQEDITHLFYEHISRFRIVAEELRDPFMKQMLRRKPFSKELKKEILFILNNKKSLNAGFIIAPVDKFIELCEFIEKNTLKKDVFGSDQFLVNIYLYRKGFIDIGSDYNFIPTIFRRNLKIVNGVFLSNGKPIPIVHNAGNWFRGLENFGYGKDYNRLKPVHYLLVKVIRRMLS